MIKFLVLLISSAVFVQCQYKGDDNLKTPQNSDVAPPHSGFTSPPFFPDSNERPIPKPKPRPNCGPPQGPFKAVVVINPDAGNVTGQLIFSQETSSSPVLITGRLEKLLPAGKHGFHVHQFGNLTGGCVSAGPHFNPNNYTHAAPEDTKRHVGDLGNVVADENGVVEITLTDSVVSLIGDCSIVGRAMVVHLKPDDLGKGGDTESLKTGNAGSRVGCGVIGWA